MPGGTVTGACLPPIEETTALLGDVGHALAVDGRPARLGNGIRSRDRRTPTSSSDRIIRVERRSEHAGSARAVWTPAGAPSAHR